MNTLFSEFLVFIPFLSFPAIKELISCFVIKLVSLESRKEYFETKLRELETAFESDVLPEHFRKKYKSMLDERLDSLQTSSLLNILLAKERFPLSEKIANVNVDVALLKSEFFANLEDYLSVIPFSPLPSETELWNAFSQTNKFSLLISTLSANVRIDRLKQKKLMQKRIEEKKKKRAEKEKQMNEPVLLTNGELMKKLAALTLNRPSNNVQKKNTGRRQKNTASSRKVRVSSPKARPASNSRVPGKKRPNPEKGVRTGAKNRRN